MSITNLYIDVMQDHVVVRRMTDDEHKLIVGGLAAFSGEGPSHRPDGSRRELRLMWGTHRKNATRVSTYTLELRVGLPDIRIEAARGTPLYNDLHALWHDLGGVEQVRELESNLKAVWLVEVAAAIAHEASRGEFAILTFLCTHDREAVQRNARVEGVRAFRDHLLGLFGLPHTYVDSTFDPNKENP